MGNQTPKIEERQTYNRQMKMAKEETMIYKALHIKQRIEQHESR